MCHAKRLRQPLEQALEAIDVYGLLLFSDPALPSVVGMIVGQPIRGSWWGHPRGAVIYRTMNALEDQPDVLTAKLIAGKVTYIHRRLWPALLAVATARAPWQVDGLSPGAGWLLRLTDVEGEVQTHDLPPLPPALGLQRKRVPDMARELERRLLVHATEVHTPSGAHAKVLQSWQRWAASVTPGPVSISVEVARGQLGQAAERLAAAAHAAVVPLPWQCARGSQPRTPSVADSF